MRIRTSGSLLARALCLAGLIGVPACSEPNEPSNQPTILLMNPMGVPARTPWPQLGIYGENFGPGATVHWNGQARSSSSYGTNLVWTQIKVEDVATEGTVNITVVRPDGMTSSPKPFIIGQYLEPDMRLASITPAQGTAGSGDLEITVTGTGFVRGTGLFLEFTGIEITELETTWFSSTTLRAVVPAAYLKVNQTIEIRLGVPGVWFSAPFLWEVQAGTPLISSLTPAPTR